MRMHFSNIAYKIKKHRYAGQHMAIAYLWNHWNVANPGEEVLGELNTSGCKEFFHILQDTCKGWILEIKPIKWTDIEQYDGQVICEITFVERDSIWEIIHVQKRIFLVRHDWKNLLYHFYWCVMICCEFNGYYRKRAYKCLDVIAFTRWADLYFDLSFSIHYHKLICGSNCFLWSRTLDPVVMTTPPTSSSVDQLQ